MAAEAAARTGAGLVSVATHPEHSNSFLARRPELMVSGLTPSDPEFKNSLNNLIHKATVLVIGPGLGQSPWSIEIFKAVMQTPAAKQLPLVVDADALNFIATNTHREKCFHSALTEPRDNWILTPHPGEAARLLNSSKETIQADRHQASNLLQSHYHGVCILKGAGSLVSYKRGERLHTDKCHHGNPGMASGGMGDILSGVLGGLLAQHLSLSDSAKLGVCIHAKSADLAAAAQGERGLLATDLLPHIHHLVNP